MENWLDPYTLRIMLGVTVFVAIGLYLLALHTVLKP